MVSLSILIAFALKIICFFNTMVSSIMVLQIYNLTSKVVVMFMHHLINMLKWSV
jgi:hypothetical protein